MASVVGLLEERELAARVRAERLREEADRVLAELAGAESEWQEWVIARQRVGAVLSVSHAEESAAEAPVPGMAAEPDGVQDSGPGPVPACAAVPSVPAVPPQWPARTVAVWAEGLDARVLRENYRVVVEVLALARRAGGQATRSAAEIAAALGMELTKSSIEGRVRHSAKRLVERGWLAEPSPGRFRLADGPAAAS
ncbi:hypothetical protein ACFV9P_31610 [Streptomyces sp. NPDC059892]|uniref:hypothetical protein n=1 Tax=Streptomyces sp. NPDC059892 TaxID=3346989 RepID=UPI003650A2D0